MPLRKTTTGGIVAAYRSQPDVEVMKNRFTEMNADIHVFGDGVFLAVIPAFEGQGIWVESEGGLCYDLDLSNEAQLKKRVAPEIPVKNSGHLLWLLYRKFGTGFIDSLRGAFAFALWDQKDQNLLVATDAFGIRPVVYSHTRTGFVAASRINLVLSTSGIDTRIDPEAVHHYFFFHAICSPVTIYKSIRKLEPGNMLILKEGTKEKRAYYDISYRPVLGKGVPYWRKRILDEVGKAVGVYVPAFPEQTGCFLSGGTDSSSVAGFYTQLSGRPAKTFSIGFDEPAYNELDYAHIAAQHFGTLQHDYYVTPKDVLDLLEALPQFYDEPFGNSSVVPAYFCAKLAKDHGVDVLLGGDGGDEIFGGNERYVDNLIFALYSRFPIGLRKQLFEPILSRLPDISLLYKAKRYVRRANIPNPDRFFSYNLLAEIDASTIFQPDFLKSVDTNCFLRLVRQLYETAAPAHDTDRLLYIDMKFTITDNDLRKVTRMAEVVGVRVLYPLLDRDLVDFTGTIPPALKVKWKKNRYIFKKAMEGFLPWQIIQKSKHGMGVPIAAWFKKDPNLYEMLCDNLFSGTPNICQWIRPEFIDTLHQEFLSDKTPYFGSNLWVFLMMELWLKSTGV